MGVIRQLKFGESSAEAEELFLFSEGAFIETRAMQGIVAGDAHLYVARKGDGKTALRLAMRNRPRVNEGPFVELSFAGLDADLLFTLLEECHSKSSVGKVKLLRNIWRYAIGFLLMREMLKFGPLAQHAGTAAVRPALDVCRHYIETNHKITGTGANLLTSVCEYASSNIEKFVADNGRTMVQENFPTSYLYLKAEESLYVLLETVKPVTVLIDDLDPWFEKVPFERVKLFVQSLILACKELLGAYPAGSMRLRLLLPQSVYYHVDHYHADKETHGHRRLKWRSDDFRKLVGRRIAVSLRERRGGVWVSNVDYLLGRIFDANLRIRDYWGRDLLPFDYVLFYSQYTPRDIIMMFRKIRDRALLSSSDPDKFSEEDVRLGVKDACYELSDNMLREYSIRLPAINEIVGLFRNMRAEMPFDHAIDRLQGIDPEHLQGMDAHACLGLLYEIGFFGKIVSVPNSALTPLATRPQQDLHYSHARPKADFGDGDILIVHPMFWDRFGITPPDSRPPARTESID